MRNRQFHQIWISFFQGTLKKNGALGIEAQEAQTQHNSECLIEDWLVSLEWLSRNSFPISVIYVLRLSVFLGSSHYLNCDGNNEYSEEKREYSSRQKQSLANMKYSFDCANLYISHLRPHVSRSFEAVWSFSKCCYVSDECVAVVVQAEHIVTWRSLMNCSSSFTHKNVLSNQRLYSMYNVKLFNKQTGVSVQKLTKGQ